MARVNIKFNPGFEKALERQIMQSPEWKRQQAEVNREIQKVADEMTGKVADEVRANLVKRLPFLKDSANAKTLNDLVTKISTEANL